MSTRQTDPKITQIILQKLIRCHSKVSLRRAIVHSRITTYIWIDVQQAIALCVGQISHSHFVDVDR